MHSLSLSRLLARVIAKFRPPNTLRLGWTISACNSRLAPKRSDCHHWRPRSGSGSAQHHLKPGIVSNHGTEREMFGDGEGNMNCRFRSYLVLAFAFMAFPLTASAQRLDGTLPRDGRGPFGSGDPGSRCNGHQRSDWLDAVRSNNKCRDLCFSQPPDRDIYGRSGRPRVCEPLSQECRGVAKSSGHDRRSPGRTNCRHSRRDRERR